MVQEVEPTMVITGEFRDEIPLQVGDDVTPEENP